MLYWWFTCCGRPVAVVANSYLIYIYIYVCIYVLYCRTLRKCHVGRFVILLLRRFCIIYRRRWDALQLQSSNRTRKKFAKLLKTDDTDYLAVVCARPRSKTRQTDLKNFKNQKQRDRTQIRGAPNKSRQEHRLTVFQWTHADVWTCVYRSAEAMRCPSAIISSSLWLSQRRRSPPHSRPGRVVKVTTARDQRPRRHNIVIGAYAHYASMMYLSLLLLLLLRDYIIYVFGFNRQNIYLTLLL